MPLTTTATARTVTTLAAAVTLVLLLLAGTSTAQAPAPTGPSRDVRVINGVGEPVPVAAQGTSRVTGDVAVSALPPVALQDGQAVGITALPPVALQDGQTVGIAGVPTVALADGTTVQVADAPGEPFSWMETVGIEQDCIPLTIPEGSTLTIQRITVMGLSTAPSPEGMYLRFNSSATGIGRGHYTPLPLGLPAVELDLTLPSNDSNGRRYHSPQICRDGDSGYATVSVVGVLQDAA